MANGQKTSRCEGKGQKHRSERFEKWSNCHVSEEVFGVVCIHIIFCNFDHSWQIIMNYHFRNYGWIMPLFTFVIPTMFFCYVMGEPLVVAWHTGAIIRYMISIHGTWCVNSVAHYAGSKPYDKYTLKKTPIPNFCSLNLLKNIDFQEYRCYK